MQIQTAPRTSWPAPSRATSDGRAISAVAKPPRPQTRRSRPTSNEGLPRMLNLAGLTRVSLMQFSSSPGRIYFLLKLISYRSHGKVSSSRDRGAEKCVKAVGLNSLGTATPPRPNPGPLDKFPVDDTGYVVVLPRTSRRHPNMTPDLGRAYEESPAVQCWLTDLCGKSLFPQYSFPPSIPAD